MEGEDASKIKNTNLQLREAGGYPQSQKASPAAAAPAQEAPRTIQAEKAWMVFF